jgi:hypothetical protein
MPRHRRSAHYTHCMSIDYKLANELKQAGFPQGGKGRWLVNPEWIVARTADRAYAPTLEELIEACSEHFAWLGRSVRGGVWTAQDFNHADKKSRGQGTNPVEAVARLWLALRNDIGFGSNPHVPP